MTTAEKFSAKEAAAQIGTDARTLRKFIRQGKDLPIAPVGQGNRYEFTAKEIKALKKQFLAWGGGKVEEATPAKKEKKGKATEAPTIEELNEALEDGPLSEDEIDEVLEVELEDMEPTDEDLDDDDEDLDID